MTKMTTEEFITKAREVHGDKYDYSKVEYVNSQTKVCIVCPIHGPFWQTPYSHLSGCGCSACYSDNRGKNRKDRMTTEEFIKKAREIHGDTYSYDKTIYKNSKTPVIITCKIHGDFKQLPNNHLKGHGCKICANHEIGQINKVKKQGVPPANKIYNDDFIQKAISVHGDKFSYEHTKYTYARNQITITCNTCGRDFKCVSTDFLKEGYTCPLCKKDEKKKVFREERKKEFIEQANIVHNGKYDYSSVNYIDGKTKVCIICPEHGPFWQSPQKHLSGQGCKKCSRPNEGLTREEFITKAKEVHGDKYDYSKVLYKNASTDVEIICHEKDILGREHGSFFQTPYEHLHGKGCAKCAGRIVDTELFITKAKAIHGDKYDYSKVEYVNTSTPVTIICPEHGPFLQMPQDHLRGRNCPNCFRLQKDYKFNLLQEFENEYAFRAFLENNDINILQVILSNIEPKYEPLKKDIEKALANAESMNPIQALEEKYSSDNGDDEEPIDNEPTTREEPIQNTPDLDDDDAMSEFINTMSGNNEQEEKEEPTIEEITRNREDEIKVINRVEHMLTPEIREYIMSKFLHDKRRDWMANREQNK